MVFKKMILISLLGVMAMGFNAKEIDKDYSSDHYKDGKFINSENSYSPTFSQMPSILWEFMFYKSDQSIPNIQIPVVTLTRSDLLNMEDYSVIRLGHSTLLFKLENKFIMTDPVFSERASPVSFLGPKRFHPSPITIDELPPIDAVIPEPGPIQPV